MSNIFTITPALHAPIVGSYSSSGSSGGPWDATIDGHVVCWYDRQETDGDFCGYVTQPHGLTGMTPGADDRITFNWRRLSRVWFDHISIYVTQDDNIATKVKLRDAATHLFGNIPPSAQTISIDEVYDGTTNKRQVPIVSVTGRATQTPIAHTIIAGSHIKIVGEHAAEIDVGDKLFITGSAANNGIYTVSSRTEAGSYTDIVVSEAIPADTTLEAGSVLSWGHPVIRLAGNRAINFPATVSVAIVNSASNDGTYTVESASVSIDEDGEYTEITMETHATVNTVNATDGQLVFSTNFIDLLQSANNNDTINISLIKSCIFTKREQMDGTSAGRLAPKAYARNTAISRIDFECAFGGVTAADLLKLNKYARQKIRVTLADVSDSGVIQFTGSFGGYLELPDEPGSRNKTDNNAMHFGFRVDSESDNLVDMTMGGSGEFYPQIVDADLAGSTITLDGDWTWLLYQSKHIQIQESTNLDNKYYHVESTTYTQADDKTTVEVFPGIGSETAPDGYVKVLGYE